MNKFKVLFISLVFFVTFITTMNDHGAIKAIIVVAIPLLLGAIMCGGMWLLTLLIFLILCRDFSEAWAECKPSKFFREVFKEIK